MRTREGARPIIITAVTCFISLFLTTRPAKPSGFPRPACGERATRAARKSDLGPVRGVSASLSLPRGPSSQPAVRLGHVRSKRQSHVGATGGKRRWQRDRWRPGRSAPRSMRVATTCCILIPPFWQNNSTFTNENNVCMPERPCPLTACGRAALPQWRPRAFRALPACRRGGCGRRARARRG